MSVQISEIARLVAQADGSEDRFFQELIEHLQEGIFLVQDGQMIFVNSALADLLGYQREEMIDKPVTMFIDAEHRNLVMERYRARVQGQQVPDRYEFAVLRKDGGKRLVQMHTGVMHLADGRHVSVGSIRDITDERAALTELQHSRAELQRIVDNLPDVFYRTDAEGRVIMISPSCYPIIGYTPDEIIGRKLAELYVDPAERDSLVAKMRQNQGRVTEVEARLRHKDGSIVWVSTNAYVRFDDSGVMLGVEGISRDVSLRKEMEGKLRYMAQHDSLTGLFNRSGFSEHLERMVARCRRDQSGFALLFIDLNGFKAVNDAHGHRFGDQVLELVGERMRDLFRDNDMVARVGGDEFTVILPGVEDQSMLEPLLSRFHLDLGLPLRMGDASVTITASVGVAIFPTDGSDAEEMLSHADTAMYEHKRRLQLR